MITVGKRLFFVVHVGVAVGEEGLFYFAPSFDFPHQDVHDRSIFHACPAVRQRLLLR